jgi:polar amino acid transport system substrate-binding protein
LATWAGAVPGSRLLLASLLWLGAGACAMATAPPQLTILTEHAPPTSMLDNGNIDGAGNVIGSGSDKVREAMARAGVAYTMEIQPWKRAYTAALERPGTCVFSTTRLPGRERLFKWVGPTDGADWVLLGRAGRDYAVKRLDDARALRIGTYNGDARDAYLRDLGFKVDPAQTDVLNPRKLLEGRIDLWAAGMRRGSTMLEQNGWAGQIVPVLVFKQVDVYLACHRSVPDALVEKLNAALAAMQRDGTVRRIDRKYEGWRAAH